MALHQVSTGPAGAMTAHGLLGVASGDDVPAEPALRIQLSALQAMCRQVFGFRLAMIALATPFAVSRRGIRLADRPRRRRDPGHLHGLVRTLPRLGALRPAAAAASLAVRH